MPNKPIKRGYKVWVRADENGFVCQFQVYTGKLNDSIETELGLRVVSDLTCDLVGKNYSIYVDNFFSSVTLMRKMMTNRIKCCATTRANRRFFPKRLQPPKKNKKILKKDKMTRGQFIHRSTVTGISAVKWMDRKIVYILSNFHNPENVVNVQRRSKDGSREAVPCPVQVSEYNKHMGYADKADMMKSSYEIDRKSKKWWHRIFFHFCDVVVINSHVIFSSLSGVANGKCLTSKQFRFHLASDLIGPVKKNKTINYRKYDSMPNHRFAAVHLPVHGNSRRCAQCSTKAKPHRSKWACAHCDVALCLGDKKNCFQLYHTS